MSKLVIGHIIDAERNLTLFESGNRCLVYRKHANAKFVERVIIECEEVIEQRTHPPLRSRFIGRLDDEKYFYFEKMMLFFMFKIMFSDRFPVLLDLRVKHVLVELESKLSFEKFICSFEEEVILHSLMMHCFDIEEYTDSIIQDIEVFECSKKIDRKISIIRIIHLEWEKPAIIERYLSDNRFVFVKLPHSPIIRRDLKVIEMSVKLCFKVWICLLACSHRIENLPFDVVDTKRKRIVRHRICHISKEIDDGIFPMSKIMIDFDQIGCSVSG